MNEQSGIHRVTITISINPETELLLDYVHVLKDEPTGGDFNGNRLQIGHAKFTIPCEVGEISTGVLLWVEYEIHGGEQSVGWHLVVEPRSALTPLAEAMEKLVMYEASGAVTRRALAGAARNL